MRDRKQLVYKTENLNSVASNATTATNNGGKEYNPKQQRWPTRTASTLSPYVQEGPRETPGPESIPIQELLINFKSSSNAKNIKRQSPGCLNKC